MTGTSKAEQPVAVVLGGATATGSAIADRLRRAGFVVLGAVPAEEGLISVLVTAPGPDVGVPFGAAEDAEWRRALDSHLRTPVDACRAVLPNMIEARRGTVVLLASAAAAVAGPSPAAYGAAAAGTILGFARSLAVEVAPHGVRVNCVVVSDEAAAAVAETVAFLLRDGDFYVGQVFAPSAGQGAT
jgi:2-hydroxycyclohexanecarboxyl-CoA dehydrogenase